MHESYKKWLNDGKPKIICQCGCGKEIIIKKWYKQYGISKYISGHNGRDISRSDETKQKISNGNLGKICSDETKQKIKDKLPNRSGKNNSFYGKHHTKETKQKIKDNKPNQFGKNNPNFDNKWTIEQKENLSIKMRGRYDGINNPFYGKKHTKEVIENMRGINNPMYGKIAPHLSAIGKRGYYDSQLQGKICFRSTYELKFAQYLDAHNILWLYEIQTFDLGNTTYTPDFYLPTCNLFVEIKGYMRKEAQEKINKFLNEYPNETLQILYKKDLIKLGCNLKC